MSNGPSFHQFKTTKCGKYFYLLQLKQTRRIELNLANILSCILYLYVYCLNSSNLKTARDFTQQNTIINIDKYVL